jgi:hypothetical protein
VFDLILNHDGVTGMTPFSQTFPWGTHFQDFKTYENAVMPVMPVMVDLSDLFLS